MPSTAERPAAPPGGFATTRWSVVLSARDPQHHDSTRALDELCRAYWPPLYSYVRRLGRSPHDAEDLTQEFFFRLLQKDYLRNVAQDRGRFRTFLLVALKHFLANEWDRANAQKRGGGQTIVPIDGLAAEQRYQVEPVDRLSADVLYDRRWALTLLDQALARSRAEFEKGGRAEDFETLKGCLTMDRSALNYVEVAARLGQTEATTGVAVHRLRQRFRKALHEEIAHTVADPSAVDAELRHLMGVLGA